jgi:hypothetical protein
MVGVDSDQYSVFSSWGALLVETGTVENCTKTTPQTQKTNEILIKTETDVWVQPVRALPGGCMMYDEFAGKLSKKIENQGYQLAEWIAVSQLKTVLNDKCRAYCQVGLFAKCLS